mmetsp:Transcript_49936/g.127028  ORF Transcript_49936/g.127028 Transcript_49936/m.127028 type:complete len:256 (+) Transcript_49936:85-852(+)
MIVLKLTAMTQHAVGDCGHCSKCARCHHLLLTYQARAASTSLHLLSQEALEPEVVCPHPRRDIAEAPNLTKATATQDSKQPSASHPEAPNTCASPPEDDDAFLVRRSSSPQSGFQDLRTWCHERQSHANGGVVRRRLAGVVGRRRGRQRGSGRGLLGQRPRVADSVLADHAGRGDEVLRQDLCLRLVALLPAQHDQLLAVATRTQKLEDEHLRSASGDGHGKLGDISNRGGVEGGQDHTAQSVVAHVARMGEHLG